MIFRTNAINIQFYVNNFSTKTFSYQTRNCAYHFVFISVRWNIQSPKIVFGGNVTLFCNTSTENNVCKGCPTSWFGGENSDVLSYNGFTSSNSKYDSVTTNDGFGITIKNLTETDLQYPYTCSYGFMSFVSNITLDETYECKFESF